MAYLIPDDVLNTLKCCVCFKYLSVKPIKVYPNRQTKCGRCSDENDNGIVSLYESIIVNSLFRCVNRYEGCNNVLSCEDMRLHEAGCIGGSYECCICSEFKGTAYEYLQHFINQHKTQILNKSYFYIDLAEDIATYYLYCQDDLIFVICLNVEAKKDYFIVDCILIGPEQMRRNIQINFSFMEKSRTLFKTKDQFCGEQFVPETGTLISVADLKLKEWKDGIHCDFQIKNSSTQSFLSLPMNLDSENSRRISNLQGRMKSLRNKNKTLSNKLKITDASSCNVQKNCSKRCMCKDYVGSIRSMFISSEIMMNHPEYQITDCGYSLLCPGNKKFDLTCSNCQELCQSFWHIYACDKCDAFICNNCYAFVSKEHCVTGFKLLPNKILDLVFNDIKIYCKWKCGEWYQISELINHHRTCEKRKLQFCPVVNCNWYGSLNNMEKHFLDHPEILFKITNFITNPLIENNKKILYLYTDRDVVVVIKKQKTLYSVNKCNIIGILSQFSSDSFSVSLQLYPNSCINKTSFNYVANKIYRIVLQEKVASLP